MDLQEISNQLQRERSEIIDLFCKTFVIAHGAFTSDELRELFMYYELECRIENDPLRQTFSFKLKQMPNHIFQATHLPGAD